VVAKGLGVALTMSSALLLLACRSAPGTFAGVQGWGPLRWEMSPEAARQALSAAHVPYRDEEMRGYFAGGPGEQAFPEHTTTRVLVLEGGTRGSVEFDECNAMTQVSVGASGLPAKVAEDRIAELERRYGLPLRVEADPGADVRLVWENASTRLQLSIGHEASTDTSYAWERYSPIGFSRHVLGTPCPPR
jgi:hypothetical protein